MVKSVCDERFYVSFNGNEVKQPLIESIMLLGEKLAALIRSAQVDCFVMPRTHKLGVTVLSTLRFQSGLMVSAIYATVVSL